MALNSFKCNYLMPLHFKGLTNKYKEFMNLTFYTLTLCKRLFLLKLQDQRHCWLLFTSKLY